MNNDNFNKENIKKTADDLYSREKKVASNAYEDLKDKAESMGDKISDTASDLYKQGKCKINSLEESMCDYSDCVVKAVKEKPLSSLLIAAAVGFLVSRIVKD